MNAIQIFLVVFVLLLAGAVGLWGVLYAMTAQRRRRYAEQVALVAGQLQGAGGDLSVIEQIAGQSSPDDPPPYGPLVKDLRLRMQRAQESYERCAWQLDALRQNEPQQPPTTTDRILAIPAQLRAWQQHEQLAVGLGQQVGTLQKQVTGAQQQAEQMRMLPLGVAGRVRSVLGATERVTRACQALQQAGVCGDGLDALIATAKTHGRAIDELPDFFREAGNDVVLARATPDSTREVWQRLGSLEKPVYDALRRAQQWQEVYGEAKNMLAAMQVEGGAAGHILDALPASVDAGQYAAELAELQAAAREIETAWLAPEVHRLADLSNAATKQVMAYQTLAGTIMSLHKTHQGFEQALGSADAVIDRIGTVMGELAQSSVSPLQWGYTAQEYGRLRADQAAIGDLEQLRNPARLEADLDRALDLSLQAGTLEAHVTDVRDRHTQLAALLSSAEVQTRDVWFQDTAALHMATTVYAPENYPPGDGMATLKDDAAELLGHEQTLAPLFDRERLPEERVQEWINRLGLYLRDRRALQARLDSTAATLHALERAEQAARAEIAQALGSLDRLERSLPRVIDAAPVVAAWNELIGLWDEGKALANALGDRRAGRVADKAAGIVAWVTECARALRDLAQVVTGEVDAARQNLAGQVDALVAIAPFDAEPSMAAALQLLNGAPARPIGGKTTRDIAALVQQVNGAFEQHVHLTDALNELGDRVVTQVEPRVTRLDEAHGAAWGKLQELQALQRQIPMIKPMPVVCDEADQLGQAFKLAEAGLEELASSGRTVKAVVGRLDSLVQQFQAIAKQGAGAQSDIERDLVRLRAVWDQAGTWMRQLKRYREWQRNDAAAAGAIDDRLAAIDRRFADIQRRYNGHPLSLEHACRELEQLLNATRGDVEVPRENGVDVIPAQTIQSA